MSAQTPPARRNGMWFRGRRTVAIRKAPRLLPSAQRKQVTSLAKRVLRRAAERKLESTDISTGVGTTGTHTDLTAVGQGDGYFERVGNAVDPSELVIRYHLVPNASANDNIFRIVVYQWHQDSTDTAPTDAEIFETTGANAYYYCYKHDSRNFRVLKDLMLWSMPDEKNLVGQFTVPVIGARKPRYEAAVATGRDHIFLAMVGNDNTNQGVALLNAAFTFTDP